MTRRLGLAFALLTACDSGDATPAKPAQDAAPAAKGQDTPEGNDEPKANAEPEAKAQPEAKAPSPPAEPASSWLVWFETGGGITTRWYDVDAAGAATVSAQADALVIAKDDKVWHVRRNDVTTDIRDCMCLEEGAPGCATRGSVVRPHIEAIEMHGGAPVALAEVGEDEIYGEVDHLSLRLVGGVDDRLFVERGDAGYYCGAHGSYGEWTTIVTPLEKNGVNWPKFDLPRTLRKQAALSEDMFNVYKECEDDTSLTLDAFATDIMRVASVSVSLDEGMVKLAWHTDADVPYVCSADYAVHGVVESGLQPGAKDLGLAAPLDEGLQAALKHVGSAETIGWSSVAKADRALALTWMKGIESAPWTPTWFTEVGVDDAANANAQRAKLDRGRRLTKEAKYDDAVAVLTEAIDLDVEAPRPWGARCYAHLLAGNTAQARPDCERALGLEANDRFKAAIHYNLGQIAEQDGKPGQAKAAYAASLKLRANKEVQAAHDALK